MIARVVFIQIKPGMKEEEDRAWNSEVTPVLKKQKGFCKAFKMQEPDSHDGIVIEFWETYEDEKRFRESKEHKRLAEIMLSKVNELRLDRPFQLVTEVRPKD